MRISSTSVIPSCSTTFDMPAISNSVGIKNVRPSMIRKRIKSGARNETVNCTIEQHEGAGSAESTSPTGPTGAHRLPPGKDRANVCPGPMRAMTAWGQKRASDLGSNIVSFPSKSSRARIPVKRSALGHQPTTSDPPKPSSPAPTMSERFGRQLPEDLLIASGKGPDVGEPAVHGDRGDGCTWRSTEQLPARVRHPAFEEEL